MTCSIDGCTHRAHARSYCKSHYERFRRSGNPLPKPRISRAKPLAERFWSHVIKSPGCWEWTASKTTKGYGMYWVSTKPKRRTTAHRLAYELAFGAVPDEMLVDHVCHNRGCVNPEHLRLATNKQNMENPAGLRSDNTSGHQGVYFHKRLKRWCARAQHEGKTYYAGSFATVEEAAEAARQLRLSLFTHNDADRSAQ